MARVNEPAARGSEGGVDGSALMRELLARKRAILIPTLLAAVAALALVTLTPSRYSGVAKVLLENQESYLTKPDKATSDLGPTLDDAAVQSAAESLATPDIARQAIEKLELDRRPEFHPSAFSRFIGTMLAGTRSGAYDDIIVETFMDRLSVFPIAHSRVLQIEFSSQDPQLAGLGANTVAELYLSQQADARRSEAKTAADWLSKRIEPLRVKVAELEAQADELRAQSGLLTGANGMTTPTQRLAELTTQIAAARAAQSAAHAKAQALSDMINSGRLEALPEAARDESLRRYIEARVAVKAEIAEASRTLLSNHPHMRELQGQLAGFDAEIRGAATKAVSAYRTDERIATDQIKDLEQAFNDQSRAVAATDGDAAKLQTLELDAKAAGDQLESYLQKYREAVARETTDATPPNARVIETASAPANPSFPKRVPTVLLATLAGFVLSLGVATARILLAEDRVEGRALRDAATPEPAAEDPPPAPEPEPEAAAGPAERRRPQRTGAPPIPVADRDPMENLAAPDAERLIAETVEEFLALAPRGPLVVLVTGEGARGALPAALGLGRCFARQAGTALLDLGPSQPWLSDVVASGPQGFTGLSDVVANRVSLKKALHPDLSGRLDIMPSGEEPARTEDLEPVIERLAEIYPFVVAHIADWRTPLGRQALKLADGALICARGPRLQQIRANMERAIGSRDFLLVDFAVGKDATERAA